MGFAASPVTRTSVSISHVAELVVEDFELRRRYLQVHLPDAALHDAQLADGDEPILIVVAHLESIHQQAIAFEHQPRDGVGVGHAGRDER